jgi:phosphatidylethanolamine-binding protein (PEBP) family uncharacterized protein
MNEIGRAYNPPLSVFPDLKSGATKAQLLEAMKGHVLAEAQLMGKYKRQR